MIDGERPHWHHQAACHGLTDLYFPEIATSATVAACRAICETCPVNQQCHDWAQQNQEREWGVWGGYTARQLAKERKAAGIDIRMTRIEHGTYAGYHKHRDRGEPACAACMDAHQRYTNPQQRDRRRTWRAS